MSAENEPLTKVHINLPNHWATDGESLWAMPLGNDLYELRNTPFYAYGLNWGDIVRAPTNKPELKPEVLEVVGHQGHRTLRVIFELFDEEDQNTILSSLENLGLSWERADGRLVALDIHSDGDYQAACDSLWKLEQRGVLCYETCEPRLPGSFDDLPTEDE